MSLLIKALDKAQEAKAKEVQSQAEKQLESNAAAIKPKSHAFEDSVANSVANTASAKLAAANALEMELSPITKNSEGFRADGELVAKNLTASMTSKLELKDSESTIKADAKSAANVFAAKRIKSNNQNTILALVAVVALCVLLAIAAYFYLFLDSEPDVVIGKPAAIITEQPTSSIEQLDTTEPLQSRPTVETGTQGQTVTAVFASSEKAKESEKNFKNTDKSTAFRNESLAENELVLDGVPIKKTSLNALNQPKQNASSAIGVEEIVSKSVSIQVSKTKPQVEVNPVLMDAFNAYNAGNDVAASKLYRQVLQRDLRNVDALLGLGVIAQRQGRVADANGWYAKVLEVEPRNTIANTAILESQPQSDVVNNESRIKSMLAKQPNDANLHAALGHFYADLNQWPAAQQAYFDAYGLSASADNALNLAVSLDQMGKPKLALPYYQRALQLAESGGSNIDKNALEARIAAIQ